MKRKLLFISICIMIIIISFLLPSIKSFVNRQLNKEFIEEVNQNAISANIRIYQMNYKNEGNTNSTSVSAGASGVIIGREKNKFYALTAEHVTKEREDVDDTQIIVLGYNDLDHRDYINQGEEFQSGVDYYKQFDEAVVEYSNEKYELAIISFSSDEDYTVLSVSDDNPIYRDKVVAMSNPHTKRNDVTAGNIKSRKPKPFGDKAGEIQHPIITHTAIISSGSSGSALLNEELEIVGINLGGNENILHQFLSGMAMPSNRIRDFLEEWKKTLEEKSKGEIYEK